MNAFWLSLHAPYRCRHAGACCTAGWAIPLEQPRVAPIEQLRTGQAWLVPVVGAPDEIAGVLATTPDGRCVFHQTDRHRCEIHSALGAAALPSACQHFPRECLIDRRGLFVTLSHYCPTAADLLFTHAGPVRIVEGPPPLPHGNPEGLDARDALPPSLTPTLLMDDDSYAAWEAHMIARLAGDERALHTLPEQQIASLVADARRLSQWRPDRGRLIDAVRGLNDSGHATRATVAPDWEAEARLFAIARATLPASHQWPDLPANLPAIWRELIAPDWERFAPVLNRYLAGHAFGSWMAYQGNALLFLVDRIHLALAVLRVELSRHCAAERGPVDAIRLKHSIRQADLLIVHLARREILARLICRRDAPASA